MGTTFQSDAASEGWGQLSHTHATRSISTVRPNQSVEPTSWSAAIGKGKGSLVFKIRVLYIKIFIHVYDVFCSCSPPVQFLPNLPPIHFPTNFMSSFKGIYLSSTESNYCCLYAPGCGVIQWNWMPTNDYHPRKVFLLLPETKNSQYLLNYG